MKIAGINIVATLAITLFGSLTVSASEPVHWTVAKDYVRNIDPVNNIYASQCDIHYDENDVLHARSKCGSFVAEVYRDAYPELSYNVMKGMFGWGHPNSIRWFDGIVEERTFGEFGTVCLTNIHDLRSGDVLVSEYSSNGNSGHTMMFGSSSPNGLAQVDCIPGYDEEGQFVKVWKTLIADSTSTPHGSQDTRKFADPGGEDDLGIGGAVIYILTDPDSGEIVGWTWSATLNGSMYQCVDPGEDVYRPLIGGYIYGPGLDKVTANDE